MVRASFVAALLLLVPVTGSAGGARREAVYVHLVGEDGKAARAPLFGGGDLPVAKAGGEVVTVDDLAQALTLAHEGAEEGAAGKKNDATVILQRLVDVRLVVEEARAMGIGELPELRREIAAFETRTEREHLQQKALRGVKADPLATERAYHLATKEWKLRSVLFQKEADARTFLGEVASGGAFEAAAERMVKAGNATSGGPAEFHTRAAMLPQVVQALLPLGKGAVTDPIHVGSGWAVMRIEDERFPESAPQLERARAESLAFNQKLALRRYYDGLLARYVKVDRKLVDALDLEASEPGIAALRKDGRVVARIQGAAPVTVGEMTAAIEQRAYHGIEGAIQKKKVNAQKADALDALVSERIVPLEAKRLGIRRTRAFRKAVDGYRESLLFAAFVARAVAPGVKVEESEIRAHYDAHRADFRQSDLYKLESLGFRDAKAAQAALSKLQAGADFRWMRANADGLLKAGEGSFELDGSTVSASTMPAALREGITGARKGDYRLVADGGKAHVVHVLEVTAPGELPFEDAKARIQRELVGQRTSAALKEWIAKLRAAKPVKIYLTRIGA